MEFYWVFFFFFFFFFDFFLGKLFLSNVFSIWVTFSFNKATSVFNPTVVVNDQEIRAIETARAALHEEVEKLSDREVLEAALK